MQGLPPFALAALKDNGNKTLKLPEFMLIDHEIHQHKPRIILGCPCFSMRAKVGASEKYGTVLISM